MFAVELVVDLPFLASEINSAHRQITVHARGMLLEAKRAGDALLVAKAKVKHGEFKAWVEANCRCSYTSAREYMQVAKHSKMTDLRQFEGGVRAFLEAHAKPRVQASPTFTEQDAERVLNIAARAERGEGAERAVAAKKLAEVAESHGTTPEPMLALSKSMCPDIDTGTAQNENEPTQANGDREEVKCPLAAHQRREDLILKLMDHDENERLEMLADALIRIEELEERFG